MLTFPKFKNSLYYIRYKVKALESWQALAYKVAMIILLLELSRIIEDFYNDKIFTDWSKLWKTKALTIGFFILATIIRALILTRIKAQKVLFLDLSDLFMFLASCVILWAQFMKIDGGISNPNPIWVMKEYVRFYAEFLCFSFTYFNWWYPFLAIAYFLGFITYLWMTLVPGFEGIYPIKLGYKYSNRMWTIELVGPEREGYLPTFCSVTVALTLFCYYFEKFKRNSFERDQEANEKERIWKEILHQLPEGALVVDFNRDIIYVNQAFYTILNMSIQYDIQKLDQFNDIKNIAVEAYSTDASLLDARGHSLANFKELQDRIWSKWASLLVYFQSPANPEYIMLKGNYDLEQRKKSIEIKFTIKNFGGQHIALFIFSDVSERLLVDSLKQSIEYKTRLLASVSHELRTPLNGNINFIEEVTQDSRVPADIKENRLIPALRSARYLLTLINDILDFSQIQAQTLRLVPTTRNIIDTVKDAIELVEIQALKKGLKLSLELPVYEWDSDVKTDHNRILQIMANLLSNALKFTTTGGIIVRIIPEAPDIIQLEIEDTGRGIKPEDQDKLFKAFGKIDLGSDNDLNPQGVGLGLVISNSLARMLGPKPKIIQLNEFLGQLEEENPDAGIKFVSEYGKGTKFFFKIEDQEGSRSRTPYLMIPAEKNEGIGIPEFETLSSTARLLLPEKECRCPEFLIVDDDAFNIITLENVLKSLKFKTESGYNGQEALSLLQRRIEHPCSPGCVPYKMIFLDCNMPIMDGYECVKKLKDFFREFPEYECPVIACTAASTKSEKTKALEAGMDKVVTKPISRLQVQKLICEYFEIKSTVRKMDYDLEDCAD